jgi:hypothetical protein
VAGLIGGDEDGEAEFVQEGGEGIGVGGVDVYGVVG